MGLLYCKQQRLSRAPIAQTYKENFNNAKNAKMSAIATELASCQIGVDIN